MQITLDQARALDALATHGTFQGAAAAMHKVHTAVLYSLKGLEAQTGLTLLDRRGYRTKLTPAGEKILGHCRALLAAERELLRASEEIRSGWEPSLRVVFDGVFPAAPILHVLRELKRERAPTRVEVSSDFLSGVEDRFVREEADLMISVLPPRMTGLEVLKLPRLTARLMAHRSHPLAKAKGTLSAQRLVEHLFLTVRGSDPRLQLSTAQLEQQSTVRLSDFHAKKAAILEGIGFGWLPDWLTVEELRRGALVPLKVRTGSVHAFEPRLYRRPGAPARAASKLIAALTG